MTLLLFWLTICPNQLASKILHFCIDAHQYRPSHQLHLFFSSANNGKTWSQPIDIGKMITNYDNSFVAGPGIGIQLKSGRLVVLRLQRKRGR